MKRCCMIATTVCLLLPIVSPLRGDDKAIAQAELVREDPISEFDREHWAYLPITRPVLPAVANSAWPQRTVDYFILEQLERESLQPVQIASRSVQLRRLKFDLLGLPPTPAELVAFENSSDPLAYEALVDRYLSSPAYGERWAQFWLDLARFAETDGFEHDKVRPGAWRYRQWVIDALNENMPYDRFIRMQLAGDQLAAPNPMATMFCLAGPDMPDINEQDLRRHDKLNELTSTIGATILGLQFHCAQCHDHKYDAISQADFYRLRTIFESAVPEMKRDKHYMELQSQASAVAPWLYHRGELSGQGPRVQPRPPRVVSADDVALRYDWRQPRLAFCDWLFSDDNPLTARVIANRIWQFHFGRSLCPNPSDLGVLNDEPTHPELLDLLADNLRSGQWSIKRLHREIVLSSTYRQASHRADSGLSRSMWQARLERDPDNELYSRFPRRRLEGETIRDALLAVSGQINRTIGGESVFPPLPNELLATLLKGQWKASRDRAEPNRRSIYVFARRNLRYPLFDAFDRPDAGTSCPRRSRSTTATQALHLLNSDVAFSAAKQLRDRIFRATAGERNEMERRKKAVQQLFLLTLGRWPAPKEQTRFNDLLSYGSQSLHENLLVASVALLNSNEFIYVD